MTRLEMLWESHDPDLVLARRFGLADAAAAATWVQGVLREHWGVGPVVVDRVVMSSGNALAWVTADEERLILKWSIDRPRFGRLAQLADLTAWLEGEGVAVSAPVPATDGRLQVSSGDVSMGVQRVVDADLLDIADLDEVRAVGAMLARLHVALASYPADVDAPDSATQPLADRVQDWLDTAGPHLPADTLADLRRMLASAPDEVLPAQLVHGDVRAANVLCRDGAVVAFIDLEEIRVDHCVLELARAAVLLGTRFHDWAPVEPAVREALLAGYRSVRPLSEVERSWWAVLVPWTSLAMVPEGEDPQGWGAAALLALRASRSSRLV